jgi:hypothetical protein
MKIFTTLTLVSIIGAAVSAFAADQPAVRVEPSDLQGPRPLQEQTAKAVVRDYLQSWKTMSRAFQQNRPDLLDHDFIGNAQKKLSEAIKEQASAGVNTVYRDRSHDVKILFYSPEGLSVELADTVEYDVKVLDHDKLLGTKHIQSRYIVVLTPTEVRWRVRIFQSQAE